MVSLKNEVEALCVLVKKARFKNEVTKGGKYASVWLAKQVTRKHGLSRRHILHFVEKMTFFSNFSTQYSSCMGLPCKKVQFCCSIGDATKLDGN